MTDAPHIPATPPDPPEPGGFWRRPWGLLHRRVIKPILTANDSPRGLALGFAMGLWVALTPTVGLQITIVVILGTLLRANRIVAVAMTWVSNPVTFIPMYYAYYRLGVWVLGRAALRYSEIKVLLRVGDHRSAWDMILECFRVLGGPLWVGSLIIATVVTLPAYPLARGFFERRARLRQDSRESGDGDKRPLGVGEAGL
ncbi:MAG: DUF2062 domain-containing protein [Planctomycetes bacterium]|nr:DUF2062 domain-containing protein [Planctomycetota bacterium]